MKIIALLAVRNEKYYLEHCLRHLIGQGIDVALIDNGSDDGTLEIAQSWQGRGVLRVECLSFEGIYDWTRILKVKQTLSEELEADWFIHHDADEIREAPKGWGTLAQGIERVDRQGYNSINFDEFVFTPLEGERFEGRDYQASMKHYYFFEPSPHRRINAWKNIGTVDIVSSGGHRARLKDQALCPTPFILRHYPGLSREHLIKKYSNRLYASADLAKGWSVERAQFDPTRLVMPLERSLKCLGQPGVWDKSDPWKKHAFF